MTLAQEPQDGSTSGRGILSAIRLTSFTSILVIGFGVATNKIIALIAGTEGVGLLGLYRTLSGIVTTVVPVGVNEIIVQRLSTARDKRITESVVGASFTFLIFQIALVLAVAAFSGGSIASYLFPAENPREHLWEVRLVLALSVGVLALQTTTASLTGMFQVTQVNRVNAVTSALTLLTVYPFLATGRIGLAFVIGFTCFLGAGLGAVYLRRAVGKALLHLERPRSWRAFRAALPISPWLAVQPLLNTGSALAVQILLNRHYGLTPLGYYNAASLIEVTSITLLMSSMRSYFLPALGKFATFAEKRLFVNKILAVLLALLVLGSTVLVLGAPFILKILFSSAFEPAAKIVQLLAISMVGQVLVWCSVMFLLHSADYKTYQVLDSVFATGRVLGIVLCIALDAPIEGAAWVHAGSYALLTLLYLFAIRARYGAFLVDGRNAALSLLVLALLVAAQFFLDHGLNRQLLFALLAALLCGSASVYAWRRVHA